MLGSETMESSGYENGRAWAGLTACLLIAGCASPGPPKPPSLNLPAPIHKLTVSRVGDHVQLQFKVSEHTTDGVTLKQRKMTAKVCREVEHGPCEPLNALTRSVAPGEVETLTDTLPGAVTSGTNKLLGYRVELFNDRDHSAGASDRAFTASGSGAAPVEAFTAQGSRLGVVLSWQKQAGNGDVMIERQLAGKKSVLLKPEGGGDPGRMLDTEAEKGLPYQYIAHREEEVVLGARKLELRSVDSPAISFTLQAVYPPPAPTNATAVGFQTEGGGWAVDLVWDPVEDEALAGYNVYRQQTDGSSLRLNAAPLTESAFHDAGAPQNASTVWKITSVDQHGNESAPTLVAVR